MKLTISAPSRLHLGFFSLLSEVGRSYGGFGVALDEPELLVYACKAEGVSVSGDVDGVFFDYARRFIEEFGVDGGVELEVVSSIPRHAGLGSGTQAALSVGALVSRLYGVGASPRLVAEKFGRGGVSGVGVGVFERGGFVADGGRVSGVESLPPLVYSRDFPGDWFFVVALPAVGAGLSGVLEKKAIAVSRASGRSSARLREIFAGRVKPALECGDVEAFGSALTDADVLVGRLFERVQGGVYGTKASADLVDFMLSSGAYGAGQSSWGPAVYGLVDKRNKSVSQQVGEFMKERGVDGRVYLSRVRNRGAVLKESRVKQV